MSGFFSSNAEAALTEEEASLFFYQGQEGSVSSGGESSAPTYQQQWATGIHPMFSSATGQEALQVFAPPTQYVSWPSTSYPQLQQPGYGQLQHPTVSTPIVPSTSYSAEPWPNAPWPSLHPDDLEAPSDISRSTSPNPADLHNFGILLPDGRSWRCAHSGCTSQARFTRGCDLRKHYHRHTKSLFCRHDDCPQSREGGFSSKKDRVSIDLISILPFRQCPYKRKCIKRTAFIRPSPILLRCFHLGLFVLVGVANMVVLVSNDMNSVTRLQSLALSKIVTESSAAWTI